MEQVGIAQSTPVTRVIAHRKKHSTLIIATYTVAMRQDAKTARMVMDSTAPSIVAPKVDVRSRNLMAPTTALLTSVCILDVTMPETVIKCTVIYMKIKGDKI